MNPNVMNTADVAGATFSLALFGMIAATVLLLLATGWVGRRWKLPLALCALVTLTGAASYFDARGVWLATRDIPVVYQYVGWMITVPVQVVALYFYVATVRTPSVALFWRLLVVAVVAILARYMGEAGFMHATLAFLIGIVGWLYILGECYFGQMGEIVAKSNDARLQRGFFWLRLIVTIGWAIYPLGNFISSFGGGVESGGLAIAYNLTDFVNRIAFGLAFLAVSLKPEEAAR
ncbi:MAG: bacteriorhodopsin [Bauldia sp.]|nr:bacteriorhodopsin [Bauldia sp.]